MSAFKPFDKPFNSALRAYSPKRNYGEIKDQSLSNAFSNESSFFSISLKISQKSKSYISPRPGKQVRDKHSLDQKSNERIASGLTGSTNST